MAPPDWLAIHWNFIEREDKTSPAFPAAENQREGIPPAADAGACHQRVAERAPAASEEFAQLRLRGARLPTK